MAGNLSRNYALLVLLVALNSSVASGEFTAPTTREQDGISATLAIEDSEAVVRWRFLRPLESPIREIVANYNGRPLSAPTLEAYPYPGAVSSVLLVLDLTDPSREAQIQRDKLTTFQLAGRAQTHHQIAIAVLGDRFQVLNPSDGSIGSLVGMLAMTTPSSSHTNLGETLERSIHVLPQLPAERRGIYVLTDGHSDEPFNSRVLIERAQSNGIGVNFIVLPSGRAADLAAWAAIAQATGGQLVDKQQRDAFLEAPFKLLDSGARASFPLNTARRYFWETRSQVKVLFHYGDRWLELETESEVPLAGPTDTATYLWRMHPISVAAGGSILIALTGFALVRSRSARRAPARPLAVLQDVETGTVYPILTARVCIGRGRTNDIIVDDMTISKLHAVLQQDVSKAFSVENRSEVNPTMVNEKRVDTAALSDGDVITLGSKKLRFSHMAPQE